MATWWDCDAVYCGLWNNEDKSFIYRGTLTLPNQWSSILGGFFTLFITLSGGYLWGTFSFVVHQLNASSRPQDNSHHQLQLILRNTQSQGTFINQLSKLAWVYKNGRPKAYYKSISLVLFASLFSLGFTLAGAFSTKIIAAQDSSVLSVTRHCGWFQEPTVQSSELLPLDRFYSFPSEQLFDYVNAVSVMSRNILRRSAGYSRSCYGRFGDNSTACGNYVRPTLPYRITRSLACPFNERTCNGSSISLDTGALRSDTDLGINTRPEDAFSVRRVLTCVPLAGENYTNGWQPISSDIATLLNLPSETEFRGYSFGPASEYSGHPEVSNYTVFINQIDWKKGKQPYSLMWNNNILDLPPNPTWNQFTPVPDVLNTSADTTIVGLTVRKAYGTAVNDPWFRADNCTASPGSMPPLFCTAVHPLSFLGCQEQYQFCKVDSTSSGPKSPDSGSCTPLTGLYKLFPDLFLAKGSRWNGTELPNLNPTQKAVHYLLAKTIASSQLHWQLGFIGHDNLIAQDFLWDGGFNFGMSAPLPSNQWEVEVMNWMNVSLANTQRGIVAYGRRSQYDVGGGLSSVQYIERPQDPELRSLCDKIKVRSARHTSFSVFAMVVVILLGLLCMLLDLVIRKLFTWFQHRTGHGMYKSQEWSDTSAFQLQRMAAEGKGIGPWKGKDKDVPTLADPSLLFNLVQESRFGSVERTAYDPGQSGLDFRYRALHKHAAHHEEEVELRTITTWDHDRA